MPIILATQEAEIRRIAVQSHSRQTVGETLSGKNPSQKRAGEVAQSIRPEFKPQYHKKKADGEPENHMEVHLPASLFSTNNSNHQEFPYLDLILLAHTHQKKNLTFYIQ
jgi:hypothetical protein